MSHHYHSPYQRGFYSFLLVSIIMVIGTVGMHCIEHMPWIDAFYFMSMIATAQGPVMIPATVAGKIFASFISFVSVGCVVAALGFMFGPFLGRLWHVGVHHIEQDLKIKK